MTDQEFEILDELYFVQTFDALLNSTGFSEPELKRWLNHLIDKGWVKCLDTSTEKVLSDSLDFSNHYKNYRYLATKAGLLAHNSN